MTASPASNHIKRLQVSVIVLLLALFLTMIISAFAIPIENAIAITTSESRTLFSDKDAFVYSANPNAMGAPNDQIFVGYDKLYNFHKERGLLHFNVSEVPVGSAVTQATFRLWLASWQRPSGSSASMRVGVHALNGDWSETSVTWNSWPGHGGEVTYRDVSPGPEGWYNFDVTSLVQAWVSGSLENHGFALIGVETEGYHDRSFWSKDCDPAKCGVDRERQPQLVIEYAPPTAIPTLTPTSTPSPTPTPWLSLSLQNDPPGAVTWGQEITYTISYSNSGGLDLHDVIITGLIPSSTTYVSGTVGGDGWEYDEGSNKVVFRPGTLARGEVGQGSYLVQVQTATPAAVTLSSGGTLLPLNNSPTSTPSEISTATAIPTAGPPSGIATAVPTATQTPTTTTTRPPTSTSSLVIGNLAEAWSEETKLVRSNVVFNGEPRRLHLPLVRKLFR